MKRWMYPVLFALAGGGLGYGYYHFFGCEGTCAITSDPWNTVFYFALVGLVLSVAFLPSKKKQR